MAVAKEHAEKAGRLINAVTENIETVIVGKHEAVNLTVLAFVAGGHVLLEDVPGTGKTSLVSALARSVECSFNRIQFTPDVMPSDITGFSVFNQKTQDFEFRPGAVMSNIVLADEVNRSSAKTQSALLEAMEERQVTVDSKTYALDEPFMVMATQNPVESYGTYPLPEAQVDRFLIKISLGYPDPASEKEIILKVKAAKKSIDSVIDGDSILQLRQLAQFVTVSDSVADYIVAIVQALRASDDVVLGASPRGSMGLLELARVYALSKGHTYVEPDDIKYLAPFVLAHRIVLSHEAKVARKTQLDVVNEIVNNVAVPMQF